MRAQSGKPLHRGVRGSLNGPGIFFESTCSVMHFEVIPDAISPDFYKQTF